MPDLDLHAIREQFARTVLHHRDATDLVDYLMADLAALSTTWRPPMPDLEEFCPRCWAGVESNQHHEQCVITGHAIDGEPAEEAPHA